MTASTEKLAPVTCIQWIVTATDEVLKNLLAYKRWLTNYEVGDRGMVVTVSPFTDERIAGPPQNFLKL
jgi:hypothetical protein